MPWKEWPIAKLPVKIKSPSRPISILPVTISIHFILLLLISGMILRIQMSFMLLICVFYPKKVTFACQRITGYMSPWCCLKSFQRGYRWSMPISPQTTRYRWAKRLRERKGMSWRYFFAPDGVANKEGIWPQYLGSLCEPHKSIYKVNQRRVYEDISSVWLTRTSYKCHPLPIQPGKNDFQIGNKIKTNC